MSEGEYLVYRGVGAGSDWGIRSTTEAGGGSGNWLQIRVFVCTVDILGFTVEWCGGG